MSDVEIGRRVRRTPSLRRWGLPIAVIGLGLLALVRFGGLRETDFPPIDAMPLGVAVLLTCVSLPALALRLRAVLQTAGHPIGFGGSLLVAAAAYFFNASTPAGLGEAGRVILLRERFAIPAVIGLASVIYERGASVGVTVAVTIVALLASHQHEGGLTVATVLGAGIVIVVTGTSVILVPPIRRQVERVARTLARRLSVRLHVSLSQIIGILDGLLRDPWLALRFGADTVVAVAAYGTQFWLVLQAMGDSVDLPLAIGLYGLSTLAGILSAIPFGLGSTDAVIVLGLLQVGVPAIDAAAAAALIRLTSTLPLVLAGIASALHLHATSLGRNAAPTESRT